ncbi:MAG: hypothetical protein P8J87_09655 [Verrucomicrobiales bacterium]|nr:hypothetical protein [Verrucomicrobiales bacterium]
MTLRRTATLTLPVAALAATFVALREPPPTPAPSPPPIPHGPIFLSHDWIELPPRQTLAERFSTPRPLGCNPDDPASRCRNCMRIRLFGAVL